MKQHLSRLLRGRWTLAVASVTGFAAVVTLLVFVVNRTNVEHGWSVPIDDTYIHFQYARSIAEGHPFSYHAGDRYSTGATSPAYVALLAIPYALGLKGVRMIPFVVVLGGVFLAASMLLLLQIGRQLGSLRGGIAAAALWGVFGFGWYCVYSGMETGFYVTLSLIVLSLFIDWHASGCGVPRWPLLLAASLLPLTRPEAIAVLGAIVVVALVGVLSARTMPRWRILIAWSVTFVPVATYVLLNRILTGSASTAGMVSKSLLHVPYKKTYQIAIEWISHVFDAVQDYIAGGDSSYLPMVLGIAGIVAIGGLAARELARRHVGPGVLIAVWTVLVLAAASIHHIRIAGWMRYYLPVLVLVTLGAGLALAAISEHIRRPWLLWAILPAMVLIQGHGTVQWMNRYAKDLITIHEKQAAAARFVASLPSDARILVCDAGAIAYLSKHWTFDVVGLTTPVRYNYFRAGVGSRFELFETISANRRPNYVAAYDFCLWPGARGNVIGKFRDMIVAPLIESGAGTGHQPRLRPSGWQVVDQLDVADLDSESDHDYCLSGTTTIGENVLRREGGITDGGRLVHRHESFRINVGVRMPMKLVVRIVPTRNDRLVVTINNGATFREPVSTRSGFFETAVDLPDRIAHSQNTIRVEMEGNSDYYSFHYFVLQPTKQHNGSRTP